MKVRIGWLLALSVLLPLSVSVSSASAAGGPYTSCAQVAAENPGAPDGNYNITVGHNTVSEYCQGLSTADPRGYLTLVNTGPGANYATDAFPPEVTTTFTKVRLVGPGTVVTGGGNTATCNSDACIDTTDFTFSSTAIDGGGNNQFGNQQAYAVASGCDTYLGNGTANVDLTGTTLSVVPNAFEAVGYAQYGSAVYSSNNQVVNVTGNGYCGDEQPTSYPLLPLLSTGTAQNTTVVSCSPASVRVGGTSTCTATVTSHAAHPSGTVTFSSDGSGSFSSPSCTLVLIGGNQSRCHVSYTPSAVGTGTHTVTGSYSGDTSSAPSSGTATVTVTKAASATSVSCTPSSGVTVGSSTACTATVTGQNPTGTVAFKSNSSGTFDNASCTLTPVDATHASCSVNYTPTYYGTGTHKIYGTYSGDTNNTTSTGSTTITVQ